jgi:hypothetical protein
MNFEGLVMVGESELQLGYWVRSIADLGVDLIKNVFFWATVASVAVNVWAMVVIIQEISPAELAAPVTTAEEVFNYSILAIIFLLPLTGYTVYRRKNAQFRNLLERAKPPLAVDVDPLEGSPYQFELITGDMHQQVVECAEDLVALRRKLRLTKQKDDGGSADEEEAKQDLIQLYEKKGERVSQELSRLSDEYHTPDIAFDYRLRIHNPDQYRLAHVKDVVVGFGTTPPMWTLRHEGFFDASGNKIEFPLTLQPGDAVLGTYRCKLLKAGTITPKKLAGYLNSRNETAFPVQVAVHCDDTMGDTSMSSLEHSIALGSLRDTLKEHWRNSEFYQEA